MTLTRRGEELIKPLEEWMAMTSTILKPTRFEAAALDRCFRIAATDYGVLSVVSPALPAIAKAAPACRIDISTYSDDMFKRLASGELDLIIYGFQPDLSLSHSRHLFTESQSIIVRADHPMAAREATAPLPLDEYLAWPHVAIAIGEREYDHVHACLDERSDERRVVARVPYFYAAPDLIGSSDAVLTMPSRAAQHFARSYGFRFLPAPEEIGGFDYWVLWHERSALDPAVAWLVDALAATDRPIISRKSLIQN